ncbi:MAG: AsmA family protein [Gammaproteobacteria bacterium]|nr:AsmA family protein [Gammaproteobacteria bacterium]NIO61759.1 AsmA family protein [Gammaproteobacteria bacterium]NIP48629.1 AsmA family protein [Gammaproteobacteria bacterium]NIQ09081.1 AsmA family protein [Gammaproteobacteria bacterium]NIQ19010.1 AsmA family protein [Gammaproteobacteria bacterium]
MKKILKRVIIVTLILIVVLVLIAGITLAVFDPNEHKDFIVSRVEQATGRSFAITGDIKLSYYPWLGLEAGGITLGNAKGFGKEPMLQLDKVAVRIKTLPLFSEQYILDTFRLTGLRLNLAKNKDGNTNWQDLAAGDGKPADKLAREEQPDKPGVKSLGALVLGGVDVRDVELNWDDQASRQKVRISNVKFKTGELTYGAPIDLDLSLNTSSNRPALKTTLNLSGTLNYNQDTEIYAFEPIDLKLKLTGDSVPGGSTDLVMKGGLEANLDDDTATIRGLTVDVLNTHLEADIKASEVQSDEPQTEGRLVAKGSDLAQLLSIFEIPAGKDLARLKDRSFDIQLGFNANPAKGDIKVDQLNVRALGIKADGSLDALAITSSKGKMDGQLNATGKDLGPLLAALGQGDLGEVLQQASLNAKLKGDKGEFQISPLQVKTTFAGPRIPNSPVDITLTADTRANLDKGRLEIPNLNLKGLGLDLSAKLNAENIMEDPAYEGQIQLAEFNLRKLAGQLNQILPVMADKQALKKVALGTEFSGHLNLLELDKLQVTLDDTTLKGNVSVADFADPDIEFDLKVDSINADRYLPPKQEGKKTAIATPETTSAAASEFPVETLRALKVKGDLSVEQIIVSNATLQNLKLGIRARDGDIRLEPIKADLYEGKYDAVIDMDARGEALKMVVNSRLDMVNLDPLLRDYMQQEESPLAGIANISLNDIRATGKNTGQVKRTLTGKARMEVNKGILRGIDIANVLEQIEVMLESKRYTQIDSSGNTPFEELSATLDINKGVITNKDLIMLAKGFKVTGEGMLANLNDETIKYNLKTRVDDSRTARGEETFNIGGYGVPIQCRGSFEKPKCLPDADEIAKALFKKSGEDKLKGLLEKKLGLGGDSTETTPADSTAPAQQQEAAPKQETAEPKSKEEQLKDTVEDVLKGFF